MNVSITWTPDILHFTLPPRLYVYCLLTFPLALKLYNRDNRFVNDGSWTTSLKKYLVTEKRIVPQLDDEVALSHKNLICANEDSKTLLWLWLEVWTYLSYSQAYYVERWTKLRLINKRDETQSPVLREVLGSILLPDHSQGNF